MRITTDDGVGLEVEVTGSGPGLVLVHGFTGAKEDFADHVPALARDRFLAPDLAAATDLVASGGLTSPVADLLPGLE